MCAVGVAEVKPRAERLRIVRAHDGQPRQRHNERAHIVVRRVFVEVLAQHSQLADGAVEQHEAEPLVPGRKERVLEDRRFAHLARHRQRRHRVRAAYEYQIGSTKRAAATQQHMFYEDAALARAAAAHESLVHNRQVAAGDQPHLEDVWQRPRVHLHLLL